MTPQVRTPIAPEKQAEILRRLGRAESEHGVGILFAVESGSRAWGFASPDSDYDGRFVYVHQPDWYLSITLNEQRDVIEYPIVDDMDINGWDVRKALRLFWKSNPGFVEWLLSPITYCEHGKFRARCLELLPEVYSLERGMHHYRSMARTTFRTHLQKEHVPLKKYFYVLRPLLAVRWLQEVGTPAPIEFSTLLETVTGEHALRDAIDQLLARKRQASESGLSPQIPEIQSFIARELDRLESHSLPSRDSAHAGPLLNTLFRETLAEIWG